MLWNTIRYGRTKLKNRPNTNTPILVYFNSFSNLKNFKKIKVSIPSLAEQKRIVSILDRFDALTTDLSQGLPAEIEKRRQQYEFYRDKLLTFKRKEA